MELANNQSYESALDILCKMIKLHLKEEKLIRDETEKNNERTKLS